MTEKKLTEKRTKATTTKLNNISIGNWLIHNRKYLICRLLSRILFNCEVSRWTKIHPSVYFHHNGMGVVIESCVVIKANTELDAKVSIGYNLNENGHKGTKSPIIREDCKIGINAVLTGNIDLQKGTIIKSGEVMIK